jgi:hypothetical protein
MYTVALLIVGRLDMDGQRRMSTTGSSSKTPCNSMKAKDRREVSHSNSKDTYKKKDINNGTVTITITITAGPNNTRNANNRMILNIV